MVVCIPISQLPLKQNVAVMAWEDVVWERCTGQIRYPESKRFPEYSSRMGRRACKDI